MDNKNEGFNYTYSAKQRDELKRIREKYLPKSEDKMERLLRLDREVTKKGRAVSLILGILGVLIMGTGMSLAMTELSAILGSHSDKAMLIGVLVGIVGVVLVALAYPIYTAITKKERERIAPEIIKLTDELMK